MPLDIEMFRDVNGDSVKKLKESQRRRFKDEKEIDLIIQQDKICRESVRALDTKRRDFSALNKQIFASTKDKTATKKIEDERKKLKSLKMEIKQSETDLLAKIEKRTKMLNAIGNIVSDEVPVSNDEKDNLVIKSHGELKMPLPEDKMLHHHELLYRIGGYEPEKGAAVAGHRGYFLTGPGVMLNMALQNFAMQFLENRGYTMIQPPYLMNREPMALTCQLSQFDEELYHVTGEKSDVPKYLIATSEQPLSAFHRGEWLHPKNLPMRYAGISTCFRKEAGAHGKDAWGIFRVHQFEKIEMFAFSSPDKSDSMFEEMIGAAEDFYKELGLSYHVVQIVSGELNNAAAKKCDLNGFFPTLKKFRELVSCSNCTDYQSRAMEIRFGQTSKKGTVGKKKEFVHLLNSTLCATERTICCILENYQTEEGVRIPKALIPFCSGKFKDFIPFVRKLSPKKTRQPRNSKKVVSDKS